MTEDNLEVKVNLDTSQFTQGVESMRRGITGFSNELSRSFNTVRRNVADVSQLFNRLDLAQITVTQSMERVRAAQERYADAIAKSGSDSEQARLAAVEMAKAQRALDDAQQRSAVSAGLVVAQSAQLAARIPAAVASLQALSAAQLTAATAAGAFASTVTLGAAAVGIVAGIAAIKAAVDSAGTSYDFATDKAAEWGTAQMVAALKAREAALLSEQAAATDWNPFTNASKNLQEIEHELHNVRSDILQNEFAIADSARRSARDFLAAEDAKAHVAARNEAVIRDELAKTLATISSTRAALEDPFTAESDLAGLKKQFADAVAYSEQLQGTLRDMAQESARGIESQAQALRESITGGLQDLGVNLESMSASALKALGDLEGPLGSFASQLAIAKDRELNLAAAALKSSRALRDQTEITADKDETTAQFHQRLKEFGFTEEEIAKRVDETGRALLRQTAATNSAADAVKLYQDGIISQQELERRTRAGSSGGSSVSTGSSHNIGVPWQGKFGLDAFLEINKENIVSKLTGFTLNTIPFHSAMKWFDSGSIVKQLQEGAPEQDPFAPGFKSLVRDLIMTTAAPQQWDDMLKALKIPQFAKGFEGVVTGPSLFVAGEAGPEAVSVRPLGRGGGGGGGNTFHFNFYSNNPQQCYDYLTRKIKMVGV